MTIKRLSAGWYRINGTGPCNWAQVPRWPCSDSDLEAGTFREAGPEFRVALLRARDEAGDRFQLSGKAGEFGGHR